MSFYPCPVCGYGEMQFPAEDDNICPCCGTQFGYDDFSVSHEELRKRWVNSGAFWFSRETAPPNNWIAWVQLLNGGHVQNVPKIETKLAALPNSESKFAVFYLQPETVLMEFSA